MSTPEPIASAIPTARYCDGCETPDDAPDDADGVEAMVVVVGRERTCLWKMTRDFHYFAPERGCLFLDFKLSWETIVAQI